MDVATYIKRRMPEKNRGDLHIPATGLLDAKVKHWGLSVDNIAYNPTTGDLLAGNVMHATLVDRYSETKVYDDYVKVSVKKWCGIFIE